ncbi:MAG: hypothetical protein IJD84_08280 [Parabacteroides sp.]|nr:hypothetical protein [Parabacteroides sp.]MBR2496755.1 hypothetical protein [Parabacteroides sp.]
MKQILKLIGSLLLGGCIGFIGVTIILVLFTDISFNQFMEKLQKVEALEMIGVMILSFVTFILTCLLQILLHEGGHLIGGLLSGYHFVSFRILNWTIIKEEGKVRIKHFSIAGTGGQCLLTPPEKPMKEIPVILYNLGGVIMNLLTATLSLILLITIEELPYPIELFLIFNCIVGYFLGLLNGIPFNFGAISNDANNMRLLLKDEQSKQTMAHLLHINAFVQKGMRPKEIPERYFTCNEPINYKNPLQINLYLMVIGKLMDEEQWEICYNKLEDLMKHKDEMLDLFVKETASELLFISLITGRKERAQELYTEELARYIQQYAKIMSSKQRILCAIALYMEEDRVKAEKIYKKLALQQDKLLMQGEVKMDLALMASILK